ncbi:uncharacterized protein CXQ87_001210 [Candidozyma duobushaemuli]|nr:uncharacterized protein CXQ87_001210 [[Candida] duobushaemulonis]PVH18290.1 hypothetical protein CXQ87_001210 [[Candida] duobushaemulonis]
MKRQGAQQRATPTSSEQPRSLDQRQQQKDNSMRLEVGNYHNSPMAPQTVPSAAPHFNQSRHNSQAFLFNPGRQDSMSTLLNSYPLPNTQQPQGQGKRQDSSFPSYYMGSRDSLSGAAGLPPESGPPGRLRGDSIFLPPPVSSKHPSEDGSGQQNAQAQYQQQFPGQSRSNSIFSSLIQIPGSSSNSVSEPSKSGNQGTASPRKKQQEEFPTYDSKDSIGQMFGWSQTPSKSNKGSKLSFDISNAFLENSGLTGSIAGVSNDSINAFLANLQNNGSVDFNSMNDQQRRDSIIKFINDQQHVEQPRKTSSRTTLREDIFDKSRGSSTSRPGGQRKSSLGMSDQRLSPSSSMSSKSSHRYHDEPHSPKTSPSQVKRTLDPQETLAPPHQHYPSTAHPASIQKSSNNNFYQNAYQQYPVYDNNVRYPVQQKQQQEPAPPQRNMNPQVQQYHQNQMPIYNQFQQPQQLPPQSQQHLPNQQQHPQQDQHQQNQGFDVQGTPAYSPQMLKNAPQQFSPGKNYAYGNMQNQRDAYAVPQQAMNPSLLPAQQFARSEDGRPLLGATKVDQLMLVIQAREKGNTGAIKQAADGSILASPNSNHEKSAVIPSTVDLVGGIEKPQREEEEQPEGPERKKKRKGKTQQCPYCFKTFNQSTHLEVHVRSHIGYKPFQCSYCLKRFTQGGNLRTHMRLHTGEKPFTCEVCNRSFSRKGNLAAHMLTHNKEKPYECKLDNCDKSFTQLGNLKSHQNKFHLPTLNRLTQTLAELSGEALEQLPPEEKELLTYFRKLYKNSNKGIRGRGRGGKGALDDDAISGESSVQSSPQQLKLPRADGQMQMSQQGSPLMPPTVQRPDGY